MPRNPISGEAPTDPNQNFRWLGCVNQETKLGGIDLYYPNADGRFQVLAREILNFIPREDLTIYITITEAIIKITMNRIKPPPPPPSISSIPPELPIAILPLHQGWEHTHAKSEISWHNMNSRETMIHLVLRDSSSSPGTRRPHGRWPFEIWN